MDLLHWRHKYDTVQTLISSHDSKRQAFMTRHGFTGWRFNILLVIILTSSILAANFLILIIGLFRPRSVTGYHVFFEGECATSQRISTIWHLVINILSTLLLAASNSGMQILCAPSREEVDSAHARGKSLHIGILALFNLSSMPSRRRILILLLTISSVPLHFFYNSVVYSATASYEYNAYVVGPDFLDGAPWEDTVILQSKQSPVGNLTGLQAQAQSDGLTYLSTPECIYQFDSPFIANFTNILLVSTKNVTGSLRGYYYGSINEGIESPFAFATWRCSDQPPRYIDKSPTFTGADGLQHSCTSLELVKNETWTVYDTAEWSTNDMLLDSRSYLPVDHCMVKTAETRCTTGFEWRLMIIVLVCNASKLVCFVSILKMRHLPLITIGDAIGSFLSSSDMSFRAHAPLTILDTRKTNWKANALKTATAGPLKQPSTKAGIRRWGKSAIERRFFFRSASISRWLITVTCCMTLLGVSIYLLLSGVRGSNNSFQWVLGQSALTTSGYLSYFEGGRLLGSLLTNLPQLLISSVYVLYNGLFTCMILTSEYSRYAKKRRPLRVTVPTGQQKQTYWLSLPYWWALPLMTAMAVLHWFVAESFYIIAIDAFDANENSNPNDSVFQVGYNVAAIALAMIVGGVLVIFLFVNGFRRYPAGVPLAASSSAAISAACQRAPDEDESMVLEPLQFGIRRLDDGSADDGSNIFIGFSAKPVQHLTEDRFTAMVSEQPAPSLADAKSTGSSQTDDVELRPLMHRSATSTLDTDTTTYLPDRNSGEDLWSAAYGSQTSYSPLNNAR